MRKWSVLALVMVANYAFAQKDYSNDVKSIDAIVAALYDVISGEAGAPRDWDRFRNLFKPEARLIPTRKVEGGDFTMKTLAPDDYVQMFTTKVTTGFFERELHRTTEIYGTIAHVFSSYETREKKDGTAVSRGINSIQLFHDGHRYYVINVFWCSENMGLPLPEKYLK